MGPFGASLLAITQPVLRYSLLSALLKTLNLLGVRHSPELPVLRYVNVECERLFCVSDISVVFTTSTGQPQSHSEKSSQTFFYKHWYTPLSSKTYLLRTDDIRRQPNLRGHSGTCAHPTSACRECLLPTRKFFCSRCLALY